MSSGLRRTPPIRLASAVLFWRLMGGFMLIFSLLAMAILAKRPMPPGHRLFMFFFIMATWSPVAFFFSSLLTILGHLTVALIVRPRLLSWQSPPVDDSHAPFHLDPRERIDAESPARMALGKGWPAGRLVLTDRRLLFLPGAWDIEPWSTPRQAVRAIRVVESSPMLWGFIRNLPPRLEVISEEIETRLFALPDARAWESSASNPTKTGPIPSRSR
jgi:hypothetical protein